MNSLFSKSFKSTAAVVDGKLILSLHSALKPVVWQMDLQDAKASSLEIEEQEKSDRYALIFKTQKGEASAIATFDKEKTAKETLMEISKALETAHGNIWEHTPGSENSRPQKQGKAFWRKALTILLIIIGLYFAFLFAAAIINVSTNQASAPSSATLNQTGTPMSADDYLKGQ